MASVDPSPVEAKIWIYILEYTKRKINYSAHCNRKHLLQQSSFLYLAVSKWQVQKGKLCSKDVCVWFLMCLSAWYCTVTSMWYQILGKIKIKNTNLCIKLIISLTKLMSELSFSLRTLLIEQLSRIFGDGGCCRQENTLIYTIRDRTMTQTINNTGAAWSTRKATCSTCRTSSTIIKKKKKAKKNTNTPLSLVPLVWLTSFSPTLTAWSGYLKRYWHNSDSAPTEHSSCVLF